VARPGRSTEEERPNEKERALCQHSRVQLVVALMPTGRNADHRKIKYVAAMPTRAIRLIITWQRDMVVSSVSRHSGSSAFRQSNTQDRNY